MVQGKTTLLAFVTTKAQTIECVKMASLDENEWTSNMERIANSSRIKEGDSLQFKR
jgi:hypothetical protein